MKRLFVLALAAIIGSASLASAGETILSSGARHAQQLAIGESTSSSTVGEAVASQKPVAAFQGEAGNLSRSGMSKGKKAMLYAGLAVAFAASAYTIDHKVNNVTPSSLGTRKD